MTLIHKKSRQTEAFEPLKLHQSLVASCLACKSFEGEAHAVAQKVSEHVIAWLATKHAVTSADIRRIAGRSLALYHPEAAIIYAINT
jgi:hypothetical protein